MGKVGIRPLILTQLLESVHTIPSLDFLPVNANCHIVKRGGREGQPIHVRAQSRFDFPSTQSRGSQAARSWLKRASRVSTRVIGNSVALTVPQMFLVRSLLQATTS